MPRTRIRADQEQDLDFVSESELNEFFGKVVITGTLNPDDNEVQDSQVLEEFDSFFPGRGLVIGQDGTVVTTGTNFVLVSGTQLGVDTINTASGTISILGAGEAVVTTVGNVITISGTEHPGAGNVVNTLNGLEGDLFVIAGTNVTVDTSNPNITINSFDDDDVDSITTSGTTVTGSVNFDSLQGITLIPDAATNTITFSGSGVTKIITVSGIEGDITFEGAGEVEIITEGNTIVVSGTPHEPAIVGVGEVVVTSGSNVITVSGTPHPPDETDVDSLTASGVTVTGSVQFETVGSVSVSADAGTDTVTISGGAQVGELVGNFLQVEFTNGGSTANTWLAVSDSNLSSTTTPWVVAYDSRLAGLAFSNRTDGIEQDIEIYVARLGDGNTSALEFTWELRNLRTAAKTDIELDELLLFEGDKVAVFCRDQGVNARDVFVGLYVEIVARTSAEITESWAGDI